MTLWSYIRSTDISYLRITTMKFIVSRTSLWSRDNNDSPCEEAKAKRLENNRVWTIEINTLEELINFRKKYGEIILTISTYPEIDNEIEIYDDYRE